MEQAIDVVCEAIRDLLARPRPEREVQLRALSQRLTELGGKLDAADRSGGASKRVQAARQIIAILENVSKSR